MATFPLVREPETESDYEWKKHTTIVVNNCAMGKTNNVGTITLTENVTSTTLTLAEGRLGKDSVFLVTAQTANAAAEIGAGGFYVTTDVGNRTVTINHANNAQTDRTFGYIIAG